MKLTIERAQLLRVLGHVQSVVERRNTIAILSNVLLRAGDGKLSVSATDMDLEIVGAVPAQVAGNGALLLQSPENQKEIPPAHPHLHAVGVTFAIVGGVHQLDIRLSWKGPGC